MPIRKPSQSRKMEKPRPKKPLGYLETGAVGPIRALGKYLIDRADRKDFNKEDEIYQDSIKLLNKTKPKKKTLLKKDK